MTYIKWGLVLFGGVLLQRLFVAELLMLRGIRPDLPLVLLAIFGLEYGRLPATIAGFGCGVLLDAVSSDTFGLTALAKTLVGFTVGSFQGRTVTNRPSFFPFIVLTLAIFHELLYNYIETFDQNVGILHLTVHAAIPSAMYTTLIGVLVYYAMKK